MSGIDCGVAEADGESEAIRLVMASDADDPLHAARAAEVTSLWRLGAAPR